MTERMKAYYKVWPSEDRMKARADGIVTDDGEAWRYELSHKDAHGEYDLWYRPPNPLDRPPYEDEKTLRDYFAGQALAGLATNHEWGGADRAGFAVSAYQYADEMLEARKK